MEEVWNIMEIQKVNIQEQKNRVEIILFYFFFAVDYPKWNLGSFNDRKQ